MELATETFYSHLDKVSISSMKIKPRVYTDTIKCLWRRRCWLCKYFCCWLGRCCCFNHFRGGEHTFALTQQPASFCSAVWHWRLLAPHYRWALSRFCSSCFVSSARDDFPRDVFALHGEVEAFALAALACVALFSHRQGLFLFVHAAVLLTTALSLAFVRFWCFFVHSIHSGRLQTNC